MDDSDVKLREWERKARAGLICWFCTDEAVATLVRPSRETVYLDGEYVQVLVNRPTCGPGVCRHGYGP